MEKKRKGANAREAGFCVCGGDFAVDFVNTRVCVRGVRVELLHSLEDVAAWLERAGKREALTDGIDTLAPDKRREVYLRIMELRDRMEEVFAAMVKGEDLPGGFVDYLNGQLESYAAAMTGWSGKERPGRWKGDIRPRICPPCSLRKRRGLWRPWTRSG